MAKYPRKPKALKMPKRPKASANINVWENFDKRRKDTVKNNSTKLSDWKRACIKIDADKKKKEKLIASTRN
jgi:hypothetical protein